MGARRRVGPAAVAAALIGLGLALHRPRLVADLRPGRGVKPPAATAAAPARTFAVPATAADGAPRTAGPDVAASAPLLDLDQSAALEEGSLRDAPADHGAPSGLHAAAARGGSFSGAGSERDRLRAPSAAELDPLTSPRTPQKSGPKAKAATSPSDPRAPLRPGDARARPRGAPLASGPAAAPDENEIGVETGGAVDSRSGAARGGSSWTRRRTRAFPLFRPPRRNAGGAKPAAPRRRVRPLLLSKLLGRGALRPPASSIAPPDLARLNGRKPPLLPDGSPSPARPFELDLLEAHDPTKIAPSCRRRGAHWDAGPLWHDGAARGVAAGERWLWLWKQDARWWALGDPKQPPLLRHQHLWWSKQRGVWFALHDGELWSWRLFSDWDAAGLLRLADGVEIVYSADFTKVAVITPGEGAVLYDAATGAELGEWLESEMPPRRPRAPAGLRLPRGI